jgi:hypothetical protein
MGEILLRAFNFDNHLGFGIGLRFVAAASDSRGFICLAKFPPLHALVFPFPAFQPAQFTAD